MKGLTTAGYIFSGFSGSLLLSFLGTAIEPLRGGVIMIFVMLTIAALIAAAILALAAIGGNNEGNDFGQRLMLAIAPSITALAIIFTSGLAGVWIGVDRNAVVEEYNDADYTTIQY